MTTAIRSALFALVFYFATVVAVVTAVPAASVSRRAFTRIAQAWMRVHSLCTRHILGIRLVVEGDVPKGQVLVAAKHEAMYETIELFRLLDEPAVVLKRELADIPGWGKAARLYGAIPVDREASAGALRRMMAAANAAKRAGRPILIFPEGTRVAPGESPPLRPGFAGLYRALDLPVVPVALDSGRLTPRGRFLKRPGTIRFRFGAPIAPGLPRAEIEARIHAAINAFNA